MAERLRFSYRQIARKSEASRGFAVCPSYYKFWKVARLAPHSCLLLAEVGLVGADPLQADVRPPPLGKSSKKVAGIAAGQGA